MAPTPAAPRGSESVGSTLGAPGMPGGPGGPGGPGPPDIGFMAPMASRRFAREPVKPQPGGCFGAADQHWPQKYVALSWLLSTPRSARIAWASHSSACRCAATLSWTVLAPVFALVVDPKSPSSSSSSSSSASSSSSPSSSSSSSESSSKSDSLPSADTDTSVSFEDCCSLRKLDLSHEVHLDHRRRRQGFPVSLLHLGGPSSFFLLASGQVFFTSLLHKLANLNKASKHAPKHASPMNLHSKAQKGHKKGGLESLTTFATPAGLVSDGIPNGLYGGAAGFGGYGLGAYGAYPGAGYAGVYGADFDLGYGAFPYGGYAGVYGAEPFGAYGFDGLYGADFGFDGFAGYGAFPYAGAYGLDGFGLDYGFEGAFPYAGYADYGLGLGFDAPFAGAYGAYGFDGMYGAPFGGAYGAYGAYPYAGYAGFW